MKKSKVIALTLAGTLAASALLAGTYAWQSISQLALNSSIDTVNPGARLHDDFNGINSYSLTSGTDAKVKNVYVENFTDADDGGQQVYARIRLEEYLEKGSGAGNSSSNVNKAKPIVSTAKLNDLSTWEIYKWDNDPTFRDYVEIGTGGTGIYMPTFNRNRDSLEADINGTLEGKDGVANLADAYDDYVEYQPNAAKVGVEIYDADDDDKDEVGTANLKTDQLIDAVIYTESDQTSGIKAGDLKISASDTDITVNTKNVTGAAVTVTYPITQVETDASNPAKITSIYVDLDVSSDNDGADIQIVFLNPAWHTSKSMNTRATIISMQDWMNAGSPLGNYWVCDVDGWAYWASAIDPGKTTGFLINSITLKPSANITGEYYYGLNVRAQFATAGDWGSGGFTPMASMVSTLTSTSGTATQANETGLYIDGITENAMRLLEKAAGAAKIVTVTTADNISTGMKGGDKATFQAKVMQGSVEIKDEYITWSVEGRTSQDTGWSVDTDGNMILTIGADEVADQIFVVATSKKAGERDTTVGTYTVPIKDSYTIQLTEPGNLTEIGQSSKTTFAAIVSKRGKEDATIGVTWSVESLDSNHPTLDPKTCITPVGGVLTVSESEEAENIKVIATCNADPDVTLEIELDVVTTYDMIKTMPVGTMQTVTIDGIEWYVLAKDANATEALLWSTDVIRDTTNNKVVTMAFNTIYANAAWYDSDNSQACDVYSYLNGDFVQTLTNLNNRIVQKKIYTRKTYDSGIDNSAPLYYESNPKVFILSEADLFGSLNTGTAEEITNLTAKDFTYGSAPLVTNEEMIKCSSGGTYRLRTLFMNNNSTGYIECRTGKLSYYWYNKQLAMRPALWISLN